MAAFPASQFVPSNHPPVEAGPHRLRTAWDVDRFTVLEEKRLVCIRFSRYDTFSPFRQGTTAPPAPLDKDVQVHHQLMEDYTARMDATLEDAAPRLRKFCVFYFVDTLEVPEFDNLFELHEPNDAFALMFFHRNKHIQVDVRTGNNQKITQPIDDTNLMVELATEVFRTGQKGNVVCPFRSLVSR